jgi:hypothetical protein
VGVEQYWGLNLLGRLGRALYRLSSTSDPNFCTLIEFFFHILYCLFYFTWPLFEFSLISFTVLIIIS